MTNNPSQLSIYQRAKPIRDDLWRITNDQLNGDIDMSTARARWNLTIDKHMADVEALAEAFAWTLHKRLVTTTNNIAHEFKHTIGKG